MASTIQPFTSENGVSPEERRNSTEPAKIAQASAPKAAPKPNSAELGLKAKKLEPFRFVRDGVTIRGATNPDGENLFDDADPASPNARAALRKPPSDQLLGELVQTVKAGNRFIREGRDQVKTVLIAPPLSSAFVLLENEPAVFMQAREGDVAAASMTHEMGHAIFNSLRNSRPELARVICHIFLGLTQGANLNRPSELARLPGIRMVSLPEWSDDLRIVDHPQGNADEFWASSFTGFLTSPANFKASIDRATKEDPDRVKKFGPALLVFIGGLHAEALTRAPFTKPMQDLIAESNTPAAIDLLQSVGKPGRIQRGPEPGDLVRLLMAL
jgi:hypothetical protein